MRFKYGLKAQKLLAQGSALGIIAINKAPCKGKSFVNCLILLKLLPLQGDKLAPMITQGDCPGLGASALSGRVGQKHAGTPGGSLSICFMISAAISR